MDFSGIFQTLFKQETNLSRPMSSLKSDQIVFGRIIKLFPNQTAEVQIGSQKMIAKLETALFAGEQYWFQVQAEEGKMNLKVISEANVKGKSANPLEGLMKELGIPAAKENIELVRSLLKGQLPITKDSITQAVEWLKNAESKGLALDTIKMMAERNLPFTKEIFSSMSEVQDGKPFAQLLENTLKSLDNSPQTNTVQQLKDVLKTIITKPEDRMASAALPMVLKEWIESTTERLPAFHLLQKAGFFPADAVEHEMLLKLNNSDIVPFTSAPLKTELHENKEMAAVTADDRSRNENNSSIFSVFGIEDKQIKIAQKRLADFIVSTLDELTDKEKPLSPSERSLLGKILKEIDQKDLDWVSSDKTASHLKRMISALGMGYEKQLLEMDIASAGEDKVLFSLKPLLIRYLNEHAGNSKKDTAEQLLNRITGLQLLSQDNGPLLQFTTQIPITFWNKTTDLTIQWSGRKKEDGKIDPHFCRVLFYLDLEYMGNTIVDMQVQNRIMTISISSEKKEIKEAASPFITPLKKKLKEMDYHLSAVTFEEQSVNKTGTLSKKAGLSVYENKKYGGVDYKV